jgi:choline monooxygenase
MNLSDYTFNPVLARASTIPARWYTDPAMLEGERRHVFGHTWQAVGRGPGHCSGQGAVIRCPYHGWTYALDGRLFGQPEFEGVEDWDRSQVCLPRFQVAEWGPFVFVNQDPDAPPLAEVLGAIPAGIAQIGCAIGRLRFSYRRDYAIACNWKVYIDNYLEGYHLPDITNGTYCAYSPAMELKFALLCVGHRGSAGGSTAGLIV